MNQQKDQQSFIKRHVHMCGLASFSVPTYHKLKPFTLLLAGLFSPYALADSPPDVYDVLLGEEPAVPLPTTAQRYHVSQEIIRTAEASNNQPSEPANPSNKINTPNKSLDGKALNKKEGANLPLGTESKDPKLQGTPAANIQLQKIQVRAKRFHEVGPLPGLGLTKDEIPGNVQSITAKEIKDSHSLSITDLMNKKLQSVNVNDYQGNPFMMDVTYRGFTAGPQIGTPQGLSVFFDGIRVNEPFGDVVNWDLIPMNALAAVDVFPGSNPIFGLGTLGGAFTVKTKDGFNHDGIDAEVLTGSFGRKQLQVTGGTNNGTFALFGAGNFFLEDGWRDNSPSKVNQFFGKASYRGEKLDLHLSTLLVGTDLVGNGLLPSEQYRQDPSSVFTAPDTTKNKLIQFQISSAFQVNDNFSITGQIYNRKSDRKSVGADVYTGYSEEPYGAPKNLDAGDEWTCLYASSGRALEYGLPDYYVAEIPSNFNAIFDAALNVSITDPSNPLYAGYVADPLYQTYLNDPKAKFAVDAFTGNVDLSLLPADAFNQALPEDYLRYAQQEYRLFRNRIAEQAFRPSLGALTRIESPPILLPDGTTTNQWSYFSADSIPADYDSTIGYYSDNGNGTYQQRVIFLKRALNADNCSATRAKTDALGFDYYRMDKGVFLDTYVKDTPDGPGQGIRRLDGAFANGDETAVNGVPNAIMTNNEINQLVKGGAVQLNWNLEHHKFMVGASIDSAYADYKNSQQLGFLDARRNVYLDPDQALDAFVAADQGISNNNFDGTSVTKSIYASETWSPVETLHVTGAVRYNETKIKNAIAVRQVGAVAGEIYKYPSTPDNINICPNGDCTGVGTGYKVPDVAKLLNAPETEKYNYYSLNPSLGATWQATPNLNIFGNVAKGTRTPSVVELGCALDNTPILTAPAEDNDGDGIFERPARYQPRSIYERRTCSLPSTLSGDPYLPQIKATTYDIGIRGTLASALGMDNIEWNLGAYRTDLKDDIYLVAVAPGRDFFDTIGKTRRQGIEAGFGGNYGKARFKINYAFTDATFENTFNIASPDNSSAVIVQEFNDIDRQITVKPGDRMPGVPLHNLNATVTYDLTPSWNVGLTAVAHSESFVRGNENNEHKQGVARKVFYDICNNVTGVCENFTAIRQPTTNPGKVPGYATFNFQTSYKFNSEWTASMQVSNLFDKEYFSAGRLGRNPFSPVIQGVQDVSGYNHNSNDWLSTNFIAPSAPRGVWFSLNWQFDPKK